VSGVVLCIRQSIRVWIYVLQIRQLVWWLAPFLRVISVCGILTTRKRMATSTNSNKTIECTETEKRKMQKEINRYFFFLSMLRC
jgi:hypothetical protein